MRHATQSVLVGPKRKTESRKAQRSHRIAPLVPSQASTTATDTAPHRFTKSYGLSLRYMSLRSASFCGVAVDASHSRTHYLCSAATKTRGRPKGAASVTDTRANQDSRAPAARAPSRVPATRRRAADAAHREWECDGNSRSLEARPRELGTFQVCGKSWNVTPCRCDCERRSAVDHSAVRPRGRELRRIDLAQGLRAVASHAR